MVPLLRRVPISGAIVVVLLAASCGGEEQIDFAQSNADSFMASCTSIDDDPILQTQICQCVIDTAEARLRFAEFDEMEAALKVEVADGEAPPPLPSVMVDIIAECVIEEGGL